MATRNKPAEPEGQIPRAISHLQSVEREALKLYRPCSPQQHRIHTAPAHELVVRGGKRSGKSTCGFAEFVSRITGTPIKAHRDPETLHDIWQDALHGDYAGMRSYLAGADTVELPLQFPTPAANDPLLYWMIGWDMKHIGQTLYRILFEPGLFRVIPDADNGQWRIYNPADPVDLARKDESRAAGPLIPPRRIEDSSWVWDNSSGGKAGNVFRSVRLTNGATICTYPSSAKAPKMGDPVSGLLIDEDIQQPDHLEEFQDRLTDRDGWFIWSSWPQIANFALVELMERAEDVAEQTDPNIESVQLRMSENPFVTPEARERSHQRMGDDENIARRDAGELLMGTLEMFSFLPALHGLLNPRSVYVAPEQLLTPKDVFEHILRADGVFPDEWTRYLAVDPSHSRSAVLFGVVPPPEVMGVQMGRSWAIERELVVKRYGAVNLAKAIKEITGSRNYEAFVMDRRMGQQTRVGNQLNVFDTYAKAFLAAGLVSRITKGGFIPSCDVPPERWAAVRQQLGDDPTLYIVMTTCLETVKEFHTYRKKQTRIGGELQIDDTPANPRKHDCMAALEYLATYMKAAFDARTAYVHPSVYPKRGGVAGWFKQVTNPQQTRDPYVHLGPGSAA